MQDEPNIGARLRVLRKWRGLTLVELAQLSGVSKTQISAVERGTRLLDRRSHIAALAGALRVSETELIGLPHISPDPEQSAPHGVVPLLREALTGNAFDDPAVDRARPLAELDSLLKGELAQLNTAADFAQRGQLAAPIYDELHFHIANGGEADKRCALALLIDACEALGMTLHYLGYKDLAYFAASRAIEAARLLDDPTLSGQAAYLRFQLMPKPTSWDRPLVVASQAAARLQPHVGSSRVAMETYGMLHLSAGLAAAAVNKMALANEHYEHAVDLGKKTGDNPDAWSAFGATNAGIWGVAIAMELGDYAEAVQRSRDVNPGRLPHRERRAVFYADTGRALAHLRGKERSAVEQLQKAESLAPQRIRNSGPVQEAITYLLNKHMRTSPGIELRGMATRMGILQ